MNTYYPTNFTIIGCVTSVKLAEYAKLHFCHTYGKSGQYSVILPNGLIKTHAKLSDVYKSIRDFITNEFNNAKDKRASIAAAYKQGLVEWDETQEYYDKEPIVTKEGNKAVCISFTKLKPKTTTRNEDYYVAEYFTNNSDTIVDCTKKVNITNINTLETIQTVRDECFVWLTLINKSWLTEDELHEQGWYEDYTTTVITTN